MIKIKSKVLPNNQPSLQDWLKEFNKPVISGTNLNNPKEGGYITIKNKKQWFGYYYMQ